MTLLQYLAERRKMIEERIAAEVLAGNEVKRERVALAELAGIEKFIAGERCKQKAEGEIIRWGVMRVDDENLTGVFVEIHDGDMENARTMLYKTVNLTGAEDKNEPEKS